MGKIFSRIINANNLAGLMLCLVIIVTIASLLLPMQVPASLAPQLEASPVGTFVSITSDTFDAGAWRVDYPRGWRVVKNSIAPDPVQVVFVAPDESLMITVGEVALTPADSVQILDDVTVYFQATALQDDINHEESLSHILAVMLASLRYD